MTQRRSGVHLAMLHSWHLYVRQWNNLRTFQYHCNIIAHHFGCNEDTGDMKTGLRSPENA